MSNMYPDVDTWNPLAGECPHKCSYCYVNKRKAQFPATRRKYSGEIRLDERAFHKNLGRGKTFFVCSCNDLFAANVPAEFQEKILDYTLKFPGNNYILQTKNPAGFKVAEYLFNKDNYFFYCTIESDFGLSENRPFPQTRVMDFAAIKAKNKVVVIEPIMDSNFDVFLSDIKYINPSKVFIGADSKGNKLPEPPEWKLKAFIAELKKIVPEVELKDNLKRLLGGKL